MKKNELSELENTIEYKFKDRNHIWMNIMNIYQIKDMNF